MPILLITTLIFVVVLNFILNRTNKTFHDTYEKEITKNVTYEPLPETLFIKRRLTDFSFIKSEKKSIEMFINNLLNIQQHKIIKPNENLTNKKLKNTYGDYNLKLISQYEHNYREYIYSLNNLAKALIDNELYSEAIKVLDEAIYCNSSMSITYSLYLDCMKKIYPNYTLDDLMKHTDIKKAIENNSYILSKLKTLK